MAPYRSKQKQSMKHKTNQDQRVVLLGPLEPITRRAIGSRSIRTVSVPFFYSSTSSSMVKCTKKAIGYPSISKASSPSFYYSTSSSNIFWTKNFLWIKKVFQTTKIFCIKNFFGTKIFLEPEIFIITQIVSFWILFPTSMSVLICLFYFCSYAQILCMRDYQHLT